MQSLQQQFQVYWKINWLRRSVITVIAFGLLLTLLPFVIQYGVTHQLKKMGASQAEIKNIDLNLFAGTFGLHKLHLVSGKNEPASIEQLTIDLNMLDLLSSKIIVDNLQIKGVRANIALRKSGEFSINGLLIPAGDKTASESSDEKNQQAIAFGLNKLSIQNADISYQETDFSQHSFIQSVNLTNIQSWNTSSTATLGMNLTLKDAPLKMTADLNLFQEIPHIRGKLSLASLPLSSYEKFYRDHLKSLRADVSVNTEFDIRLSDAVAFTVSGTVDIANLDLNYRHINQTVKVINWKGKTALSNQGKFSVTGNAEIEQINTVDKEQDYLIASAAFLNVANLEYDQSGIKLDRFELNKSKLIELSSAHDNKPSDFILISKLNIQGLNLQPDQSRVTIEQINMEKPELTLTLDKQKQVEHLIPLFKTIASMQPTSPPGKQPVEQNSDKAFIVEIGQFNLIQPGLVKITDNSVSPVYQSTIHLNRVNIQNISSLHPANFDIALKQGDHTDIHIKGDGLLFNPTEKLQLKANIKQLDLPPVTPYTSGAMGYGMKSGVVDSDIQLKLERRIIDSVIDLKVDSIEVVETHKQTAEQISSASGMSIDLAVSTLKDSNNVIELKLPVKGNIDQPDFDLKHIINKAMGKAMKSATLTYLKHSLQPFGSLITLFNLAKAAADHISLPPILFKANSLQFADQQQDLLNKISRVLKDRPGLKIKACGVSALEDQQAIHQALVELEKEKLEKAKKKVETITVEPQAIQHKMKELADQRAAKVKSYFLEKGNLDSSRILNCLSATNTGKDSKPSVEMEI